MNIWVNGCFDILHTGHINLLWFAKLYETDNLIMPEALKENNLFVGIDADKRVKMLKGEDRPINNEYDRIRMLSNLRMVDSVVKFHDNKELEYFIKIFEIDYLVIGDDYKDKLIIGAECTKNGVVYFPKNEKSTTNIINKINKT